MAGTAWLCGRLPDGNRAVVMYEKQLPWSTRVAYSWINATDHADTQADVYNMDEQSNVHPSLENCRWSSILECIGASSKHIRPLEHGEPHAHFGVAAPMGGHEPYTPA